MNVYFARPISLYDTPQDERDLRLLKQLGFEVVNPNKKELSVRYEKEGMNVFYEAIEDCDALAFRSFPDLSISAGVYGEIQKAEEIGCLIIELPTITSSRVLSVDDTRAWLKYLGAR